MVSRNCIFAIIWLFIIGNCNGESSVATDSSISPNNVERQPLFFSSAQLNTPEQRSSPNPTLVHRLASSLTTTSYNFMAGRQSSMDYLPLVMPTMSSAYKEITEDKKSAESFIRSDGYPQSTVSANHLYKQSKNSATLETRSGILENPRTDYSHSRYETIQDYMLQSSLTIDQFKPSKSADDRSVLIEDASTGYSDTMRINATPKVNSILSSSDVQHILTRTTQSSRDYVLDNSHVFTHTDVKPTFSHVSNSFSSVDIEPSEWHEDLYPTVAYTQPMFSEFSNSFEIFYDVDSADTFRGISSNRHPVSPMSSRYETKFIYSSLHSSPTITPLSNYYKSSPTVATIDSTSSLYYPNPSDATSTIMWHTPVLPSVYAKRQSTVSSQLTTKMPTTTQELISSSSSSQLPETSTVKILPSKAYLSQSSIEVSSLQSTSRGITLNLSSSFSRIVQPTTREEHTTIDHHHSTESFNFISSTQMQSTISSEIITPVMTKTTEADMKNVFKDCRFLFTFAGDCQLVTNNTLYLAEFIEGLRETLVEKLDISNDRIKPHDISCGSIKIYVTFKNVSCPEMDRSLKTVVASENLVVPTFIENKVVTFTAQSVLEVALQDSDINSLDLPGHGIDKIDIIVIIVACCICGVLLVIGITVCIKECYRRKYAQSFDLLDMPHVNLKLEDFTLTRIPRPKTTYTNENTTNTHSYPERYSQPVNKENGHQVNNGNHINLNDVHVRMQPLSDGIVVGVTGYVTPNGTSKKKKHAPSASSNFSQSDTLGDPSTENLVPDGHFTSIGALNPIFVDDDDQGSTSTLDISQAQTGLSDN
ncbi:uncharacterized protein LOC126830874 [Patella vulgata]|uniref:uncharacterized protein LOC126830874 n=1 Tax=Patella vulgata TaxID=6465 RepID=UPI0021803AA0|nr:uncharacterized protein LOC126830874 [Patella vulgata]XP_050417291.1 uncharacterized protein LOC126830874 [Patella vulgata]XP_050417292.1 uncharacterized protein LOC126830874 [Patella vulgata]XP_050417293.1 uncharacterized protein LOC126830874 [Patella vulgata]